MKLTRYEQETVIRFDEEGRKADVYTHNKKIISRLAEFKPGFLPTLFYGVPVRKQARNVLNTNYRKLG